MLQVYLLILITSLLIYKLDGIGYLPQNENDITTIFNNIANVDKNINNPEFIKSQYDSVLSWFIDYDWFGSLTILKPNRGYFLKMLNSIEFYYNIN